MNQGKYFRRKRKSNGTTKQTGKRGNVEKEINFELPRNATGWGAISSVHSIWRSGSFRKRLPASVSSSDGPEIPTPPSNTRNNRNRPPIALKITRRGGDVPNVYECESSAKMTILQKNPKNATQRKSNRKCIIIGKSIMKNKNALFIWYLKCSITKLNYPKT